MKQLKSVHQAQHGNRIATHASVVIQVSLQAEVELVV